MSENKPLKHRGFRQGLHVQSTTAKEILGQVRHDGHRSFRYAKNGATALSAGKLNLSPAVASNHDDEAILVDVPIGAQQLALTVTVGVAIAANALVGGFLQINSATGLGHQYMINGNTPITAAETVIYIALEEPGIIVALDNTSTFNLVPSPQYMVVESNTDEAASAGVPLIAVDIAHYFWNQVGGVAMVLQGDSSAVGTTMINDAGVAGAVTATGTDWDADVPVVGVKVSTIAVDTEYGPVNLTLI
jgi:hypothetical protein